MSELRAGRGAAVVVAAGIAAAMHVGKLPPALPVLRGHFDISLLQASLLVSAFQVAGLSLGIVGGMLADRFGARRVMTTGLALLGLCSLMAPLVDTPEAMLGMRALESAGFILSVLPGPVLLRRMVPAARQSLWLGYWGSYMPIGMGSALVFTPWLIRAGGWSWAWVGAGLVSLAVAVMVWWRVDADPRSAQAVDAAPAGSADPSGCARPRMGALIADTLGSQGPWILALAFGCYAAQWMGVFSFLPTIYQAAGLAAEKAAALTAFATLVNLVGNVAGGRFAQQRVPPERVLMVAALAMALGAWIAFGSGAPFWIQYLGILMLTVVGGLIPGTLFTIAPSLAPHAGAVSTTVGLMQQGSTLGQFLSPPMLAALAGGADGWARSWQVTGLFALGDVLAAWLLWRLHRRTRAGTSARAAVHPRPPA